MKKTVVILLAVVMALGVLSGCQSASTSVAPSGSEIGSAAPGADTEGKKIGVIFYGKEDALGAAVYATINHAAEALGVEIIWDLGDVDPNAQIAAAENLISAGVDGIMAIPLTETVTQKIMQRCEENQVYYVNCFRDILDENIREYVTSCEYFVGGCFEDDSVASERMVEIMAEKGKTKAACVYLGPGSALRVRNEGFDRGMENTGIEKVAEYTVPENPDLNAQLTAIENFINVYVPSDGLDVIFAASGAMGSGEAMVQKMSTMTSGGSVQMACFDVFENMKEAFENEILGVAVGGQSPDALMAFMMLYNKVVGTPLSDEVEWLNQNYIFVTSAEECDGYEKYIDNPDYMIYTADDIRAMSKAHNPDFTIEELRQIMEEYTLGNVVAKAEATSNN